MFKQNRNIDDLALHMKGRVRVFMKKVKDSGFKVLITEGRRAKARQVWLYSFGRFGANKAKAKVTWTLDSNHIIGEAIDIVPLKDGKAWWDAPGEVWSGIYRLARQSGLKSLYEETGYDRPHLDFDHLWSSDIQKQIDANEKILRNDMDKAWKAVDNANARKRYLASLKSVPFKPYIIIEQS